MFRARSIVLGLTSFIAIGACGCDAGELEEPGTSTGEQGGLASGAGEAAEAAGVAPAARELGGRCEMGPEMGAAVPVMRVAEPLPVPHGGPLPNGVHVLVAQQIYTGLGGPAGPTGQVRRQGLRLTSWGHRPHFTDLVSVDGGPAEQRTFSMRTSGSTIGISPTCPEAPGFAVLGYTILGDKLLIIDPASGSVAFYQRP